jgi:predicted secreted protein
LHSTSGAAVLALEGGFVLAGNRSPQVGGIEHGWLIRTDAGGKLLWEKTFGTTGNDEFRAMTKAGAGLAMAGGSKQAGAPGQAVWLLQVDALGNLQWEKTFAVAGIEGAIALALTPDGFLVAGYAKPLPPTTQAAKILRTDAFGNLTCATSGPCAGKPFGACDDANPCTADLCDAAHNGCWHADLPDKATCGAGKVCQGGKCL